jgi:radical SAM superfamily enzyme YgiQ (UPF0313 family)
VVDAKRIFKCSEKFDISKARLPDQKLLDKTIDSYYGGIIEVARGCPFLCEFCDIRNTGLIIIEHTVNP